MSVRVRVGEGKAFSELCRFRTSFHGCLSVRSGRHRLELTDALLCASAPTRTPVELSLTAPTPPADRPGASCAQEEFAMPTYEALPRFTADHHPRLRRHSLTPGGPRR
ncbi:hypothetical protein RB200_35480 [Streptomyces sp. PmtG]